MMDKKNAFATLFSYMKVIMNLNNKKQGMVVMNNATNYVELA